MDTFTRAAGRPVDEHGRPVARTKREHPFSYDGFVAWQTGEAATATDYSDRLFGWDPGKHDRLCLRHWGDRGQSWGRRQPTDIEAFLRDYHDAPGLVLVRVMEYCNVSSGYPVWRFDYRAG